MAYRSFLKNKSISYLVLLFFSSTLFATPFATNGHFYLSGTIGPSFAELSHKRPTITYSDGILSDAYPLNQTNQTRTMLGISSGYEFTGTCQRPAIAFGLGAYTTPTHYNYKGQVIETAAGDPSFLLYNYKANIRSTRLMAEMQLTWLLKSFLPFINVGIGPAWNYASGYSESVASPDGFLALPPFKPQTNIKVAYQAGFGIGYGFNKCNRLSLGYRYVNAGTMSFGTRGFQYHHRLNMGNFIANDVYLVYTHLF